ncbi:hypothetical protein DASC09_031440 [Saccharomycopsis crataegensis]|uniref:Uncharacterized protein n=1 Tax=Saccharomycopsis crataegensis TaxID=43959 RepID=A0AAV5QN03_9ASCO|nr:hypothetical protein DASC09_031440 [Saccharomycopsis crataegensis]
MCVITKIVISISSMMTLSGDQLKIVEYIWGKIDVSRSGRIPCEDLLVAIDLFEEVLQIPKFSLLDQSSREVALLFIEDTKSLEINQDDLLMLLDDIGNTKVLQDACESFLKSHPQKETHYFKDFDYSHEYEDTSFMGEPERNDIFFQKDPSSLEILSKRQDSGYISDARSLESELKYRDQVIESLESEHKQLLNTINEQNLKLKEIAKESTAAQNHAEYVEKQLEQTLSVKNSVSSLKKMYEETLESKRIAKNLHAKRLDDDRIIDDSKLYDFINNIESGFSELDDNLEALKAQSALELSHIHRLDSSNDNHGKKLRILNNQLNYLIEEFNNVRERIGSMDDSMIIEDAGASEIYASDNIMTDIQYKEISVQLQKIRDDTNFLNGSVKQSLSTKNIASLQDIAILQDSKYYDSSLSISSSSSLSPPLKSNASYRKRPRKIRKTPSINPPEKSVKNSRSSTHLLKKPKSQILLRKKSSHLSTSLNKNCESLSFKDAKFDFLAKEKDNSFTEEDANNDLSINSSTTGSKSASDYENETCFSIGNSHVDVLYSNEGPSGDEIFLHRDSYDADFDSEDELSSMNYDESLNNIFGHHKDFLKPLRKKASLHDELINCSDIVLNNNDLIGLSTPKANFLNSNSNEDMAKTITQSSIAKNEPPSNNFDLVPIDLNDEASLSFNDVGFEELLTVIESFEPDKPGTCERIDFEKKYISELRVSDNDQKSSFSSTTEISSEIEGFQSQAILKEKSFILLIWENIILFIALILHNISNFSRNVVNGTIFQGKAKVD